MTNYKQEYNKTHYKTLKFDVKCGEYEEYNKLCEQLKLSKIDLFRLALSELVKNMNKKG